jgi:hypothetical protein
MFYLKTYVFDLEVDDVDNWKKLSNSRNRVTKKSFGGTFCFSNCHIIGLDTGGLVFLVSGHKLVSSTKVRVIIVGKKCK